MEREDNEACVCLIKRTDDRLTDAFWPKPTAGVKPTMIQHETNSHVRAQIIVQPRLEGISIQRDGMLLKPASPAASCLQWSFS